MKHCFLNFRKVVFICFFAFCFMGVAILPSSAEELINAPGIVDGSGIWLNLWNYPEGDLDAYCKDLENHGVRNLFIQTSRPNTPALKHPIALGNLIEACHRHRIRIIGWSFAELVSPEQDAQKLIDAARFTSVGGEHLDAVAANLEKDLTSWKVEKYSAKLRRDLGANYPLLAVVFSPLNKAPQAGLTPWKLLGGYYDVIAPMAYWSGKHQPLDAYTYTAETVKKVRELSARPDLEIHVIGDGMGTSDHEFKQCMKAASATGASGVSLYPNHKVTTAQMKCLTAYAEYFEPNTRFKIAALRELMRNGNLAANFDPMNKVSKAEFYKYTVAHLLQSGSATQDASEAFNILANLGAISNAQAYAQQDATFIAEHLSQPVYFKEALSTISALIEIQSQPQALKHRNIVKRLQPGRWFANPAMAATSKNVQDTDAKLLNYLDLAHLIVSARSSF